VCVYLVSDPDIMKSGSRAMSSTAEENLPDDVENGDHTTVAVFQRQKWVVLTKSVMF
jgi:hypothetical protein